MLISKLLHVQRQVQPQSWCNIDMEFGLSWRLNVGVVRLITIICKSLLISTYLNLFNKLYWLVYFMAAFFARHFTGFRCLNTCTDLLVFLHLLRSLGFPLLPILFRLLFCFAGDSFLHAVWAVFGESAVSSNWRLWTHWLQERRQSLFWVFLVRSD